MGKLMFNLPLEKQRKTHAKEFIEFFQRCSRSKDLAVRTNAAINLPCFFYYFGNYDVDEIDFVEFYCEFADDEDQEVKEITAKGIHEVLTLTEKSGKSPFMFGESFQTLAKFIEGDPQIQLALVQNLGETISSFSRGLVVEILNAGFSIDTFTEESLKLEQAQELVEQYQYFKDILQEFFSL